MMRQIFMKAFCGAGLVALAIVPALAQERPHLGIFVTPVPNVPLSATAVFEESRPLPDGSRERLKTTSNIARDSSGRIYNEQRQFVPVNFAGTPQLFSSHIYDPATRLNTFWSPGRPIARQSKLPGAEPDWEHVPGLPSAPPAVPGREPLVRQEDLGTQVMENLTVRGVRIFRTVPANVSGTGQAVVVTEEFWYSDDLHLNMLVKRSDPRAGEQTMTLTQIKRGEPDPQLFIIPKEYKVVDETPPGEPGK